MNAPRPVDRGEVQCLVYSGYGSDHALHLVLRVENAALARAVLRSWLSEGRVTFAATSQRLQGVDIGFTYRGLQALQIPDELLRALGTRAPAFTEGAPLRATRHLGDAGDSAPAQWQPMFQIDRAHVLVSIHDDADGGPGAIAAQLAGHPEAARAFSGWEDGLAADHFPDAPRDGSRKIRIVHFGFRDNVTRPTIDPERAEHAQLHKAGELLLGHANKIGFDRWGDATLATDAQDFFRNGSFAALRKIEQFERKLDDYLDAQVEQLQQASPTPRPVTAAYLKAKMCGRWENGALIAPGETAAPSSTGGAVPRTEPDFDFAPADEHGLGCPFGSHIRRTNPRDDRLLPPRLRPLFRRGMPYGPPYPGKATAPGADEDGTANPPAEASEQEERGLVGLFFCASLEDQFEHLLSEWVEKNPMGPPNRGRAKDPLIGHHDEPDAGFHIPRPGAEPLVLKFEQPFVRTRGTLYALFPSRTGLRRIARCDSEEAARPLARPAARGQSESPQADGAASGAKPHERGAEAGLAADTAPRDRFCDLVLEGGITSGIVYAPAVVELARHYRFANIAGSSIGAFAAALAAAAEFGRRKGSMTGFQVLGALPTELAKEESGRTVLERLFRPQPRTRRLFSVFHAMLGRKSTWRRVFDALGAARRAYAKLAWISAALAALAVLGGPLLAAVCQAVDWCAPGPAWPLQAVFSLLSFAMLAVVGAFIAAPLVGIVCDLLTGLIDNGFGLCRGWNVRSDDGIPDLTGYLHDTIQKAAGLDASHDRPLTFADLHGAPGAPAEVLDADAGAAAGHSINLQVYASHLVHGRPYRFPLDTQDDTSRLFFRPAEMRRYFPPSVVAHMLRVSTRYAPTSLSDPGPGCDCTSGVYELPQEQLPIVVAARMAMSFPLLISAVPVWSIDYEARRGERHLKRCWMSDGGLCSNFPIHLFDALVPRWPTFGIALERHNANKPEPAWLPDTHRQGRADTWARGIEPDRQLQLRPSRASRLANFLLAIWNTTWAWNDQSLKRMPGVRDRVVRIRLKDGEGGVNLRMTGREILHLASTYGRPAGLAFVRKFVRGSGWDEHRWVRFNRTLIALRQQIEGLRFAAHLDRHTQPLGAQIEAALTAAPLRGHPTDPPQPSEQALTSAQASELQALRQALTRLEDAFAQAGNTRPYHAVPRPAMRARPPY